MKKNRKNGQIPEFEFAQSTQQGFYLIKELDFPANISENGLARQGSRSELRNKAYSITIVYI